MRTIFFDLETTDLNFVGQILNYAFVCVDDNWDVVSQLSGNIRISNTQLPSVHAVLANRVDVLEHQKTVQETEPNAMVKIRKWLDEMVENSMTPVKLIGYNSIKFDLPFLRTSMIRNGVNPYHPNLRYGDLLHVAQKLAAVNTSFNAMLGENKSLKLSRVAQLENVLQGEQEHESLADVMLTIDLAKHFATYYGLDVRTYNEYEVKKYQNTEQVVIKVFPERDSKYHQDEYANNKSKARMICLDYDKSYSLWIDIDLFAQGKEKEAISWYSNAYSTFFFAGLDNTPEALHLGQKAKEALGHYNLKNFFPDRHCDIEQFIYMMKFDESGALSEAIWSGDTERLKNLKAKFGSKLYLRYLMNNEQSDASLTLLKQYSLYRYGGKMKINKMDDSVVHPTYKEMLDNAKKLLAERSSPDDKKIITSLIQFYESSPVVAVAGDELRK